jgi:hypothetical protein
MVDVRYGGDDVRDDHGPPEAVRRREERRGEAAHLCVTVVYLLRQSVLSWVASNVVMRSGNGVVRTRSWEV